MERASGLKARQIKAARALLDWSQEDLAGASGLSIATIRKLEMGHISPRGKTQHMSHRAFEDAGLEFLEPDGVRHRPDDITVYEGMDGFKSFFDDIYNTSKRGGEEIVIVCASPSQFGDALGDHLEAHLDRMMAIREIVSVKCLFTDMKPSPRAEYVQYRWLSKHYVDSVPFYIYGNKYAAIMFETDLSPKVIVIHSPMMAAAFRQQFKSMWDKATPLKPYENTRPYQQKKTARK